jgi:anti-sigma factor RsiW
VAHNDPKPDDEGAESAATEELVAYLDGELDPKASEALATRLSLDPKLRAEADALQRAWEILDVLPRPLPSATFATRTLSQAIPVPVAPSGTQVVPFTGPAFPTAALPPARPAAGFWLASSALILAAAIAGYFGHRALAPAAKAVSPDPPLEDVTLMKNLRLYRNVDDMDYLKKLDSPELFGDESE